MGNLAEPLNDNISKCKVIKPSLLLFALADECERSAIGLLLPEFDSFKEYQADRSQVIIVWFALKTA